MNPHGAQAPSAWIRRWAHLAKAGGTALDLACGQGRHARWLAEAGLRVDAVDHSAEALAVLKRLPGGDRVTVHLADIENRPWPLTEQGQPRRFDLVVVTNYLWRPLWPVLLDSLAPGGVLLYETFAHGQAEVGRPARPEFLLQPGELLERCRGLRIVAFEDGFEAAAPRFVQRIAAIRSAPRPDGAPAPRHDLSARDPAPDAAG